MCIQSVCEPALSGSVCEPALSGSVCEPALSGSVCEPALSEVQQYSTLNMATHLKYTKNIPVFLHSTVTWDNNQCMNCKIVVWRKLFATSECELITSECVAH